MTSYQTSDDFVSIASLEDDAKVNLVEPSPPAQQFRKSLIAAALVVVTVLVGLFAFTTGNGESFKNYISGDVFGASDTVSFSLSAYNPNYDSVAIDSANDLPWDAIAEPYRTQVLRLDSLSIESQTIDLTDTSKYTFSWEIDGETYTGSSIEFQVDQTGVLDCTLTVTDTTTQEVYESDFTLAMKYVRREIRSLTDDDRETLLNSMHTLYTVSTTDGQTKYGSKYKSAEYFAAKHLNGAGRVDCDHWHDGAGIITHHMALTLEFEQSLQAVNPSVALPYWEYAKDAYLYDNWYDSPVFGDDWFGIANPLNDDHSLDTGRFGDVEMPSGTEYKENWSIAETKSLNPYVNARGTLRSPWNNNPSMKIGRHNSTYGYSSTEMPSCNLMHACYSSNSLSSMNDCLNGVTHGPVHVMVGGLWGQGDLFEDRSISFLQGLDRLLLFKMLWRMGYTRCPTSCKDEDQEECACSIPDEYLSTYTPLEILQTTAIYDIVSDHIDDDSNDELLTKILRAIEDPDIAGEMFSSAATYDPLFWPVHGQLERIVALKRIQLSSGEISSNSFDSTWGYSTSEARFLKGVCDWSGVKSVKDLTLPVCNMSTDAYCFGHDENDELEFTNFLNSDDTYTNIEFFDLIHPWTEELPYVYDTYRFDYCEDYGYTFA